MSGQKSSFYIPLMILVIVFAVDRTYGETDAPTTALSPVTTSTSNTREGIEISEAKIQAGLALLEKTVCGVGDAADDDVENANISEYPWIAVLVYLEDGKKIPECGGSLIHERYVLTAAHCIRIRMHSRTKLVSVRLGGYNIDTTDNCTDGGESRKCAPPVQEINVAEAIYHKDYNPRAFSNDVGIVRLVSNAVIATNVKPICLPITPASKEFDPNRMLISGWSVYENRRNGTNASNLQKRVVQIKPVEYCQELFRISRLTQNILCAVGDICKGDSGGPLFKPSQDGLRYIQYGIFNAGVTSCGPNNTAVYGKVDTYLPWIASNLN